MCWIASRFGWLSIVRKGAPGEWQVRARLKQDLQNVMEAAKLEGQKVIETIDGDYRFRLIVRKDELHRVFEALEVSIDYPNFKNAVAKVRGQERHLHAYHTVWSLMSKLQSPPQRSNRRSLWDDVEQGLNETEPQN